MSGGTACGVRSSLKISPATSSIPNRACATWTGCCSFTNGTANTTPLTLLPCASRRVGSCGRLEVAGHLWILLSLLSMLGDLLLAAVRGYFSQQAMIGYM